jgi:DNA-binding MarR family transcriptional regulator
MAAMPQPRRRRPAQAIAELIEQLSRSVANRAFAQGMNPAQWTALRFIAHANESVRHVGGFATFHLTTPSSASQTMTALVQRGLVVKTTGDDGRQRRLDLTPKGRQVLRADPIDVLSQAIDGLSDSQLALMAEVMQVLIQATRQPPADSDKE